jgi:hypothetical protein
MRRLLGVGVALQTCLVGVVWAWTTTPLQRAPYRTSYTPSFLLTFSRTSSEETPASGESTIVTDAFVQSADKLDALAIDPATGDFDALEFLDAVDELTPALKSLGAIFSLASSQIFGNVDKLRGHLTDAPAQRSSLQTLILAEVDPEALSSSSHHHHHHAAVAPPLRPPRSLPAPKKIEKEGPFSCFLWASFALAFTEETCRRLASDEYRDRSMADCVGDSYDVTLRHQHGPMLASISRNVLRVVPASREMLIDLMGPDEAASARVLQRWADAYNRPRQAIERFYEQWPERRP